MAASKLITLDQAKARLSATWLGAAFLIILLVAYRSLVGKYGGETQEAWEWLLPTIMPSLGLIISTLGYTALNPSSSKSTVHTSFFRISELLSIFYLLLVMLTVLIQPTTEADPISLMKTSSLWLGPLQGIVAAALGVLFASKKKTIDY